MKNRNMIFVFVVLSIMFSIAKVYFIKDFAVEREAIPVSNKEKSWTDKDLALIETRLETANIHSATWVTLVNYKSDLKNIINKENAADFFKVANNNLATLVVCLRKDLCGLTPEKDEPNRTAAHLLIARLLNAIELSIIGQLNLRPQVDWNLIREISGLEGNEMKVASLELLQKFDVQNGGIENLLKIADSYPANKKASFYAEIAPDLMPHERPVFMNAILKTISLSDFDTTTSIVDKIKIFRLNQIELSAFSKSLCRFKKTNESWIILKNKMLVVDKNFENNCTN